MSETDEVAVMVLVYEGDFLAVPWDDRQAVFTELETAFDDCRLHGDHRSYSVSFRTMPRAEYEALPEFEGF